MTSGYRSPPVNTTICWAYMLMNKLLKVLPISPLAVGRLSGQHLSSCIAVDCQQWMYQGTVHSL